MARSSRRRPRCDAVRVTGERCRAGATEIVVGPRGEEHAACAYHAGRVRLLGWDGAYAKTDRRGRHVETTAIAFRRWPEDG